MAVIGAGAMGLDQCLGLQAIPRVEIACVADTNPQSLDRLRQRVSLPGVRFYSSVEALLQKEKVELVCVATNTTSHLAVARLAIEAGVRRLILEKPIGNNVARARELRVLCAELGVKVAVNHSRRWFTDYAAVKRCLMHGFIGRLREIHSAPGPGGLAMIGSHFFDLFSFLAGSRIEWVCGFLEEAHKPNRRGTQFKDPGGRCLMGLDNGVRAYLDVSDDLGNWDGLVVLRGDGGRIEIDERAREWHLINRLLGRRTFRFLASTKISDCFARVALQVLSEEAVSCGTAEGIDALEAVTAAHLSNSRDHSAVYLPIPEEHADMEMPFP